MRSLIQINAGVFIFIMILLLTFCYFIYPPGQRIITYSLPPTEQLVARAVASINSSLPHYEYKKKEDSIRQEIQNASRKGYTRSGWTLFDMGVSTPDKEEGHYYLTLKAYTPDDYSFVYSLNDKNYLEYMVWDSVPGNGSRQGPSEEQTVQNATIGTQTGHYETKEIPVKITQEKEREAWTAFFRISRTTAVLLRIVFIGLIFLTGIGILYTLFYLPLRFLFLVVKGKAFSDEAIGILYFLSTFLLIIGAFAVLSKIFIHLIFASQLPSQIHFSYYDAAMGGWHYFIAGLITLLFAKAFLRGSELQHEQALTI